MMPHEIRILLIELMAQASTDREREAYAWLAAKQRQPFQRGWYGIRPPAQRCWWSAEDHAYWAIAENRRAFPHSVPSLLPGALYNRLRGVRGVVESWLTGDVMYDTDGKERIFLGNDPIAGAYRSAASAWCRLPKAVRVGLQTWEPPA